MKKNILIVFLVYAVIYLFGIVVIKSDTSVTTIYKKVKIPTEIQIEKIVDKNIQTQLTKYDLIEQALTAAKNSGKYETGVYDCSEFSEALVHELTKRGFWATISYGYNNEIEHAWVAIQIEPQAGEFLKPDSYKLNSVVELVEKLQNSNY